MQLSLNNFATLVQQAAAAAQAGASQILDFTVGSVLRALMEANASIALWLQWLIILVLQTTRFATSSGADADSFGADFGFTRLPAVAATGFVTFSRYAPTLTAVVPAGVTVATADGSRQFSVIADSVNAAWNATANAYLLGAGVSSLSVPVVAVQAGAGGNLLPNMLTLITSPIPGIDTVTNAAALTSGVDAEPDASFRARFQGFLDSRSRSTIQAITFAVLNLQQGLSCTVLENTDASGAFRPGFFQVTVDDGSGTPPSALIAAAQAAIEAVRPVGSIFAVSGPVKLLANISMTLSLSAGALPGPVTTAVSAALTTYINGLPVGGSLPYTKLAQVTYDAISGIENVAGLTLQGAMQDLQASPMSVIRIGTLAINT